MTEITWVPLHLLKAKLNLYNLSYSALSLCCMQCLSVEGLQQLLSNYSSSQQLQMEDFFTLAPALCLFLSDPLETCRAVREGRWAVETHHFIQNISDLNDTNHPPHEGIPEYQGLEKLFDEIEKHYQPDTHEVSNGFSGLK